MQELCSYLKISVNELLSGEELKLEDYGMRAEENLRELAKIESVQNKKLLFYENVIGCMSTVAFLMRCSSTGRSWKPVGVPALASTTSMPSITLPKAA